MSTHLLNTKAVLVKIMREEEEEPDKKLEISFDGFAAAMIRRRPNEPSLINSSIWDICKNNVKKY